MAWDRSCGSEGGMVHGGPVKFWVLMSSQLRTLRHLDLELQSSSSEEKMPVCKLGSSSNSVAISSSAIELASSISLAVSSLSVAYICFFVWSLITEERWEISKASSNELSFGWRKCMFWEITIWFSIQDQTRLSHCLLPDDFIGCFCSGRENTLLRKTCQKGCEWVVCLCQFFRG